jgi:integrase
MHPRLIELGLLDYKQECESDGEARLFPEMPTASEGYQSSAFSKRFSRYLQKCGVKTDKRLSLHSFRHTIKDQMREAGINPSVQDAICGHEAKVFSFLNRLVTAALLAVIYGCLS